MIDNAIALEQGKIKTFWDLKHIKGVHPMDVKFYFTQICMVFNILCTKYIDKSATRKTDNGITLEEGRKKVFWDLEHIKGVHPMDEEFYFTQICIVVNILCTNYIDKSTKSATRKDCQWDSIGTRQE